MFFIWKISMLLNSLFFMVLCGITLLYLPSTLHKFTKSGFLSVAFSFILVLIMSLRHYVHAARYYLKNKVSNNYIRYLAQRQNLITVPGIGISYPKLVQGIPPPSHCWMKNNIHPFSPCNLFSQIPTHQQSGSTEAFSLKTCCTKGVQNSVVGMDIKIVHKIQKLSACSLSSLNIFVKENYLQKLQASWADILSAKNQESQKLSPGTKIGVIYKACWGNHATGFLASYGSGTMHCSSSNYSIRSSGK